MNFKLEHIPTFNRLIIHDLPSWKHGNGYKILDTNDHKWDRRNELEGVLLKAKGIISPPYITALIPNSDGTVKAMGLIADMVYSLGVLYFCSDQFDIFL